MASTDWTFLNDGLNIASLDRGVTTGITPPNGGGAFIFGFNSLVVTPGASGLFTNQSNFAPTSALKGGSVRGAVQRGVSGGDEGFSPFLFICLGGTSVNDSGYLLGLEDDEPHRISLRKGALSAGIPGVSPGVNGVLRRSTATHTKGTWLHLRLDAVVNLNGDVLLKVFSSDLDDNPVTAPVWSPVSGIEDSALVSSHGAGIAFVDDALGVNSGSAPYTSGRMGFGFATQDVSRRGFFDHLECYRQL